MISSGALYRRMGGTKVRRKLGEVYVILAQQDAFGADDKVTLEYRPSGKLSTMTRSRAEKLAKNWERIDG